MILLLFLLLALILSWPSMGGPVSLLDGRYFICNQVRSNEKALSWRRWMNLPRILTVEVDRLNWRFAGFDPFIWHVFNVSVHVFSVYVLYAIGLEWWPARASLLALLFLVHPMVASSVCYVAGRSALLSGLFVLLTVYAVVIGAYGAVLPCAVIAFLFREDACLPLAVWPLAAMCYKIFEAWR